MNQRLMRALACLLALAGIVQIGVGLYPWAKGQLAMQLIERSYLDAPGSRPWPGADFRVVARLDAPRLGVRQYVLDDASARTLAFGPGLTQRGDDAGIVLSAHRDSHFDWLQQLQRGDVVQFTRDGHEQRFEVVSLDVVDRRVVALKAPSAGAMVLTTCWPFDALTAGGDLRYVVTAVPVAVVQQDVTQMVAARQYRARIRSELKHDPRTDASFTVARNL